METINANGETHGSLREKVNANFLECLKISQANQPLGYAQLDAEGNLVGTIVNKTDTAANIISVVGASGEVAYATDTDTWYYSDGTGFKVLQAGAGGAPMPIRTGAAGVLTFWSTGGDTVTLRRAAIGAGSNGISYSINGAAGVYTAIAADTDFVLTTPSSGGVYNRYDVWVGYGGGPLDGRISYFKNQGESGLTEKLVMLEGLDAILSGGEIWLTGCSQRYVDATNLTLDKLTILLGGGVPSGSLEVVDLRGSKVDYLKLIVPPATKNVLMDGIDLSACVTFDVTGSVGVGEAVTALEGFRGLSESSSFNIVNLAVTSLNISGMKLAGSSASISGNVFLASITAIGFQGIAATGLDLSNNLLGTDAVWEMLNQMDVSYTPSSIKLTGNPCEVGNAMVDGNTYTAAETIALAITKSYTLTFA